MTMRMHGTSSVIFSDTGGLAPQCADVVCGPLQRDGSETDTAWECPYDKDNRDAV